MSETRRRYKVSYVRARHINSEICMTTYYSQHSNLYLKGDGLKESGFETGCSVTVKISKGHIVLMA
ncbi:SymE family type I addiction module toxin [Phytobacter ursingii]|uniref:SymE family type I addiction module toxin n=1 Tax=Phytobacter ursingii TaxID=1972431 RepID=UPI003CCCB6D9